MFQNILRRKTKFYVGYLFFLMLNCFSKIVWKHFPIFFSSDLKKTILGTFQTIFDFFFTIFEKFCMTSSTKKMFVLKCSETYPKLFWVPWPFLWGGRGVCISLIGRKPMNIVFDLLKNIISKNTLNIISPLFHVPKITPWLWISISCFEYPHPNSWYTVDSNNVMYITWST